MKPIFSIIVQILCLILPKIIRYKVLKSILGYEIDSTAKIGLSVILSDNVEIGKSGEIGSFTIIRRLNEFKLGSHSRIGNFNWISGGRLRNSGFFPHKNERHQALLIGKESAITSHHRIDASDLIQVGDFTIIGGNNSLILTHSVDIYQCKQECEPIEVGSYCFIGAGCILLPGTTVPDYSIVAAGSVVHKNILTKKYMLYGGVPAKPIKKLPKETPYFNRIIGIIK